MLFQLSSFAVLDQVDMKLVVYAPLTEEQTTEKLTNLLHMEYATACAIQSQLRPSS